MVAIKYHDTQSIKPAYDHAAVHGTQTGVPTGRRSSNSTTTAHINHGAAGVSAGEGQWGVQVAHHAYAKYQADKAAYESSHSPTKQAHDRRLNDAADRWLKETHGPDVHRAWHDDVQRHGKAYDPTLLAMMRKHGTEQMKLEQERATARGVEQAQGHKPKPAVPTHAKQATNAESATKAKQLYRRSIGSAAA